MKFYHSAATALRTISREAVPDDFAEVEARYPFLANDYYLSLIDPRDPDDPVRRQLFPDRAELADAESEFDPLAEARQMPVVLPERVTQEIADYLGSVPGLWFLTHFNHVNEATDAAMAACARLIRAGVPVLNQTVLLRGVNDTPEKLEALFRKLIARRAAFVDGKDTVGRDGGIGDTTVGIRIQSDKLFAASDSLVFHLRADKFTFAACRVPGTQSKYRLKAALSCFLLHRHQDRGSP